MEGALVANRSEVKTQGLIAVNVHTGLCWRILSWTAFEFASIRKLGFYLLFVYLESVHFQTENLVTQTSRNTPQCS